MPGRKWMLRIQKNHDGRVELKAFAYLRSSGIFTIFVFLLAIVTIAILITRADQIVEAIDIFMADNVG